jgi:hypothetical protein
MNRLFQLLVAMAALLMPLAANAQLTSLASTTDSVTIVMTGAPAVTQPNYSLTWNSSGGDMTNVAGPLTGVTAVTALTGPDSGSTKNVTDVVIYNADTTAVTVIVNKKVGSTSYPLLKQSLAPAQTLTWNQRTGVQLSSTTAAGAGTIVAVTGLTLAEGGNGSVQKTIFTLTNVAQAVVNGTEYQSTKLYDFPDGRILVHGCTATLQQTTTSAIASTLNSGTGAVSLGTAAASATTLATTMVNVLPSTAFTSSATINVAGTAVSASLAASAQVDGTGTALDLYLNSAYATTTDVDADATQTWSGTITVTWTNLGDY